MTRETRTARARALGLDRGRIEHAILLTCRGCKAARAYTTADLPSLNNSAAAWEAIAEGWQRLGRRRCWHCPACVARARVGRRDGA